MSAANNNTALRAAHALKEMEDSLAISRSMTDKLVAMAAQAQATRALLEAAIKSSNNSGKKRCWSPSSLGQTESTYERQQTCGLLLNSDSLPAHAANQPAGRPESNAFPDSARTASYSSAQGNSCRGTDCNGSSTSNSAGQPAMIVAARKRRWSTPPDDIRDATATGNAFGPDTPSLCVAAAASRIASRGLETAASGELGPSSSFASELPRTPSSCVDTFTTPSRLLSSPLDSPSGPRGTSSLGTPGDSPCKPAPVTAAARVPVWVGPQSLLPTMVPHLTSKLVSALLGSSPQRDAHGQMHGLDDTGLFLSSQQHAQPGGGRTAPVLSPHRAQPPQQLEPSVSQTSRCVAIGLVASATPTPPVSVVNQVAALLTGQAAGVVDAAQLQAGMVLAQRRMREQQ